MTPEQTCFLQLLRPYVHGRPSTLPSFDVDWIKVARYAQEQSLCGIIYVQCRGFLTEDSAALDLLHHGFYSAVYAAVNGEAALNQAADALERAGIPYLPFKGEVLRRYYPQPELRTMGDKDILIHQEHRKSVDQIMLLLGYEKFVDNHAVWTYLKPNLMFEIHDVMFYEYLRNTVDYREYFQHIWESAVPENDKGRYNPDPNYHFVYLMCHTAKHIINKGIGFRAFLDILFMAQKEKDLQWGWITGELERLKLLGFTETCFAFCKRWFDVDLPLPAGELDDNFFAEITAKTFRDGTFGLHNMQNEAAHSAKEIHRAKQAYWKTALVLTWNKLFPSYEDMQLIPWYRFVDGRPWLLPLAWVYRWFYVLTHKFKYGKKLLVEPFAKRDLIEKRNQLINTWKL